VKQRIALALVAFAALLALPLPARAENGVVQGQVINSTAGSNTVLEGLPVRLFLYSGNTLRDTLETVTDGRGIFRFSNVPAGGGWTAVARVEYLGVEYGSVLLDLSVGTDFNGDILVYETTSDDSALRVERSHLIIEMGVGQLEVTEMIVLVNDGDRTYVGSEEVVPGKRATARVLLPAGATDVSVTTPQAASAMVRTGDGLADTRPVVPGQHEYVVSYALACDGPTFSLLKPVLYPTDALDVLVAAPGADVDAPVLERLGTRETSGATYEHLRGRSLPGDTDVVLRFRGLRQPASVERDASRLQEVPVRAEPAPWTWGLLPLGTWALLALAVAHHLQRTKEEPLCPAAARTSVVMAKEARRVVGSIADLDERYDAGGLEETRYHTRRRELVERLLALLQSSRSGERHEERGRGASGARSRGDRSRKAVRTSRGAVRRRPQAG
jgi:hypothetical protein